MTTWNNKKTDCLIDALVDVGDRAQMKNFLRDLLTEPEIIEFGRRWEVAQMLYDGVSYSTIVKKTGLSSTTIARISKWVFNGKGGYQSVLGKLHHHAHTKSGVKVRKLIATRRP